MDAAASCAVMLALTMAAALALAGAGNATTPSGWTTTKAAAQVQAKVKLPWCRATGQKTGACPTTAPANSDVVDGPFAPPNLKCSPYRDSQIGAAQVFSRFRCDWAIVNDMGHGSLLIYVTGKTTFRWKSL